MKNSTIVKHSSTAAKDQIPTAKLEKDRLFEMSSVIFTKPWDSITPEEHEILVSTMSYVQYFREANQDSSDLQNFLKKCCEAMTYEFIPKKNVVFHFGEVGDKFYVILKGKVDIYIPRSETEIRKDLEEKINQQPEAQKQAGISIFLNKRSNTINLGKNLFDVKPKAKILSRSSSNVMGFALGNLRSLGTLTDLENNAEIDMLLPEQYYINGIIKFKCIKTLGAGAYFGEVALTTDKLRSATILAAEDLHVVTITKKDYKMIFDYMIQKMKSKIAFFESLFESCSMESVVKFTYFFTERSYKYGQTIYSQGDDSTELFVVRAGEVQIVQSEKVLVNENKDEEWPPRLQGMQKSAKSKFMVLPKKFMKNKIVNLGPGNFFGEEDVLEQTKRRASAISTDSETSIYCMSIEDLNYMPTRYPDIMDAIKSKLSSKSYFHNQRISNLASIQKKIQNFLRDSPIADASVKNPYMQPRLNSTTSFLSLSNHTIFGKETLQDSADMNSSEDLPNSPVFKTVRSFSPQNRRQSKEHLRILEVNMNTSKVEDNISYYEQRKSPSRTPLVPTFSHIPQKSEQDSYELHKKPDSHFLAVPNIPSTTAPSFTTINHLTSSNPPVIASANTSLAVSPSHSPKKPVQRVTSLPKPIIVTPIPRYDSPAKITTKPFTASNGITMAHSNSSTNPFNRNQFTPTKTQYFRGAFSFITLSKKEASENQKLKQQQKEKQAQILSRVSIPIRRRSPRKVISEISPQPQYKTIHSIGSRKQSKSSMFSRTSSFMNKTLAKSAFFFKNSISVFPKVKPELSASKEGNNSVLKLIDKARHSLSPIKITTPKMMRWSSENIHSHNLNSSVSQSHQQNFVFSQEGSPNSPMSKLIKQPSIKISLPERMYPSKSSQNRSDGKDFDLMDEVNQQVAMESLRSANRTSRDLHGTPNKNRAVMTSFVFNPTLPSTEKFLRDRYKRFRQQKLMLLDKGEKQESSLESELPNSLERKRETNMKIRIKTMTSPHARAYTHTFHHPRVHTQTHTHAQTQTDNQSQNQTQNQTQYQTQNQTLFGENHFGGTTEQREEEEILVRTMGMQSMATSLGSLGSLGSIGCSVANEMTNAEEKDRNKKSERQIEKEEVVEKERKKKMVKEKQRESESESEGER